MEGDPRDNGVSDRVAEVRLSSLLHLAQDHGGDLLRGEGLVLATEAYGNDRFGLCVLNLEWEVFPEQG